MLKIDSLIVLQNINMLMRQLFLLFEKSTTFWDNPRTCIFTDHSMAVLLLWIFFVTYVSCLSCYLVVYLLQSCGHLLGKG